MVTIEFTIAASVGGIYADVVGEFLSWVPLAMTKRRDGSFAATIRLETNRQWQYRFLIDDERWMNDRTADDYITTTTDGSTMSVLQT